MSSCSTLGPLWRVTPMADRLDDAIERLQRIEDKLDGKVGRGEMFSWLTFTVAVVAAAIRFLPQVVIP